MHTGTGICLTQNLRATFTWTTNPLQNDLHDNSSCDQDKFWLLWERKANPGWNVSLDVKWLLRKNCPKKTSTQLYSLDTTNKVSFLQDFAFECKWYETTLWLQAPRGEISISTLIENLDATFCLKSRLVSLPKTSSFLITSHINLLWSEFAGSSNKTYNRQKTLLHLSFIRHYIHVGIWKNCTSSRSPFLNQTPLNFVSVQKTSRFP